MCFRAQFAFNTISCTSSLGSGASNNLVVVVGGQVSSQIAYPCDLHFNLVFSSFLLVVQTSNAKTWDYLPPTLTSVRPATGPAAGGITIGLYGSGS